MAYTTHRMEVYPFAYHKILGGKRKIDIRPYIERLHKLRVGDMIEYVNAETQTHIIREVKGIALFDNFDTLIKMLPPEMIGYHSREEIRVRIERMYNKKEQCEYGVCALFIDEPDVRKRMKFNYMERSA
ncbi:MAG: hypothetical protein NC218_05260 [Acetobacter sp.]|nr:hypothetical protein [Acetobacter sp.]